VPTRTAGLTGAGSQPCVTALARGLQGGPAHRVRKARFERASREV